MALTLGMSAASSASAGWFVNGKELSAGSAALLTSIGVHASVTLLILGQKITIKCISALFKAEGPEIIAPNKIEAASLRFEGCATTEPASGCALEESTVPTKPVLGTVTLATAPADRVAFTPETGKVLAQIPFKENNTCAFTGQQPIKGAVVIHAPTGQRESEVQALEGQGSLENNSLEVGSGNKSIIDANASLLFALTAHLSWGFK
jgi:hypothetical protein